jgi:hypothetical protein
VIDGGATGGNPKLDIVPALSSLTQRPCIDELAVLEVAGWLAVDRLGETTVVVVDLVAEVLEQDPRTTAAQTPIIRYAKDFFLGSVMQRPIRCMASIICSSPTPQTRLPVWTTAG